MISTKVWRNFEDGGHCDCRNVFVCDFEVTVAKSCVGRIWVTLIYTACVDTKNCWPNDVCGDDLEKNTGQFCLVLLGNNWAVDIDSVNHHFVNHCDADFSIDFSSLTCLDKSCALINLVSCVHISWQEQITFLQQVVCSNSFFRNMRVVLMNCL